MSATYSINPEECMVVKNSRATFCATPYFVPMDAKNGDDIGKLFKEALSRVKLTIIPVGGSGSVFANVEYPSAWAGIEEKFRAAVTADTIRSALSLGSGIASPSGAAYTVTFRAGKLAGQTPAQVALLPDGEEQLLRQRDYLRKNLVQYPANSKTIEAIDEALELLHTGMLGQEEGSAAPSGVCEIYKGLMHGNRRKPHRSMKDMYFCSDCTIQYQYGQDYPVTLSIRNYYAPISVRENGSQQVLAGKAVDELSMSFRMSIPDFSAVLLMVSARQNLFLNSHSAYFSNGIAEAVMYNRELYAGQGGLGAAGAADEGAEAEDAFAQPEQSRDGSVPFMGALTACGTGLPTVRGGKTMDVVKDDGEAFVLYIPDKCLSDHRVRPILANAGNPKFRFGVRGRLKSGIITYDSL